MCPTFAPPIDADVVVVRRSYQAIASTGLLQRLLSAYTHSSGSHLDLVLPLCAAPALVALARCSWEMHEAVIPHLGSLEQASAAKLMLHFGCSSVAEMAAQQTLTGSIVLANAQCRHLGVWLREGGVLGRVEQIRLLKGGRVHVQRLQELRLLHSSGMVLRVEHEKLALIAVHLIGALAKSTLLELL